MNKKINNFKKHNKNIYLLLLYLVFLFNTSIYGLQYQISKNLRQLVTKIIIIKMSLQKIKSAKHITYTDRYSKNPIINTLIKGKLQTQMVGIKQSFNHLIKKQQAEPAKTSTRLLKRNKSYSINPHSIQEALQYNPLSKLNNKATQQFIANRQADSYLIPLEQLNQINRAREEHSGLTTKLKKTDVIKYEAPKNFTQFTAQVQERTIQEFSQEVWLPTKPEVLYLIQDKKQQIQNDYKRERGKTKQQVLERELQKFTNKITGSSFNLNSSKHSFPLVSSNQSQPSLKPVEYIPQRYHKNDYKLIESWLENILQQINKQTKKPEQKLNMVYSSYICVWKQIVRLTYIQSEQKGLIVQKMIYSMLRLFWGLITEQQHLFTVLDKQSRKDNSSLNQLMEMRIDQLNSAFVSQEKQIQQLKEINHKVSKVFVSFQKINHQLVDQLQKLTKQKKKIQKEFNSLNHSFFRTLQILYDKKLIEMDFSKQQNKQLKSTKKSYNVISYRTFFVFDKNSKPTILGRFKYQDNIPNPNPRYADEGLQQTFSQELRRYNERYGQGIKEVENELTRFWQKKQQDLQIKGIINSLILQVRMRDACVGTAQFQNIQYGVQFPENSEYFVQNLLRQLRQELTNKFNVQKKQLQSQIQQKDLNLSKWKQNSQELQQKYKALQQTNLKLSENIKKAKESNNQLLVQIQGIAKVQEQERKNIQELKIQLQNSITLRQQAKLQKQKMERQRNSMSMELQRQKQNNRMLVRGNLQMKQKVQKFDIRYNTLVKSVKNTAPWLQKFMYQADKPIEEVDMDLLKKISDAIQQNLSDFVVKDSSLFMTRL